MTSDIDWTVAYENALIKLREDDPQRAFDTYIDADVIDAAKRFAASEEFSEIYRIFNSHNIVAGAAILDIGAGNGIASYALAKKGYSVTAIEPLMSHNFGASATSRLKLEAKLDINVISSYAECLPFRNSCFDAVYVRQTLHHARNLARMISEAARVLREGGLFLATREHVVSNSRQLKVFLENHPVHQVFPCENAYKENEYIRFIRQAGLRVIKVLKPFDSVINLYPLTDTVLRKKHVEKLARLIGPWLSKSLMSSEAFNNFIRVYLNLRHRDPGRLYSFLAVK